VRRGIAWSVFGLVLALAALAIGLAVAGALHGIDLPPSHDPTLPLTLTGCVAALLYATVGLLIARREPRNAIGWIFLGSAATLAAMAAAYGYADLALYGGEGWPAAVWAGWFANWSLIPPVFLAPCLVAQLFPSGRPLPGAWRWVFWVSLAFAVQAVLTSSLAPGHVDPYPEHANPAGLTGTAGDVVKAMDGIGEAVEAPALFLVSLAALVVRFRRSRGIERQQMKWLTFAGALLVAAFAISFVASPLGVPQVVEDVLFLIGIAALVLMPVSVAVAILRYRLYEIDRVISRTIVYGGLTLVLGAAYAVLVLAGQALFSSFAGGSNLAIAVSTLVVAALALPLRKRVQRFVDRRFYRRRYDAGRTLEAFGARLRDQIELGGLRADLEGVVRETMQPEHVSLWLRPEARR